jgi:hypothetical protein
MPKIIVHFDVLNSEEIVNTRKGKLVGWLASRMKGGGSLKKLVEQRVCEEVVAGIRTNLDENFREEGIAARLRITVENED